VRLFTLPRALGKTDYLLLLLLLHDMDDAQNANSCRGFACGCHDTTAKNAELLLTRPFTPSCVLNPQTATLTRNRSPSFVKASLLARNDPSIVPPTPPEITSTENAGFVLTYQNRKPSSTSLHRDCQGFC